MPMICEDVLQPMKVIINQSISVETKDGQSKEAEEKPQ